MCIAGVRHGPCPHCTTESVKSTVNEPHTTTTTTTTTTHTHPHTRTPAHHHTHTPTPRTHTTPPHTHMHLHQQHNHHRHTRTWNVYLSRYILSLLAACHIIRRSSTSRSPIWMPPLLRCLPVSLMSLAIRLSKSSATGKSRATSMANGSSHSHTTSHASHPPACGQAPFHR